MPTPSSRPPLTEGVATVMAQDRKVGVGQPSPSEVPLAFQDRMPGPAAAPQSAGSRTATRTQALALLAVVILIAAGIIAFG